MAGRSAATSPTFYLANLAWLGQAGLLTIHPGKTNREFELELRRKARTSPEARVQFSANVAAYERTWFGMHEVSLETIEAFRERAASMKRAFTRPEAAA